ncbi:MAG: outer membrane lipoprotein LolB [Gammaproteobacteria bacterium]|nr:outer membrane lipoprotein LolB [Gammaproteobacteria bacterium]
MAYNIKNYFKILFIIFIIHSLPQCSTIYNSVPEPKIIPEAERKQTCQKNTENLTNLNNNKNWHLQARVGITSRDSSGSSQLDWKNDRDSYSIVLSNAITFGEVVINNNNKITLSYNNQEYIANTPEKLLYQLTNMRLPISAMRYWVLGLPAPSRDTKDKSKDKSIVLNKYGTIEHLNQNGFRISYDNYGVINNIILPHKITLISSGLHIKIQVNNWNM